MSYETACKCDTCGRDISRAGSIREAREAALRIGAHVYAVRGKMQHACGPCEAKRLARMRGTQQAAQTAGSR